MHAGVMSLEDTKFTVVELECDDSVGQVPFLECLVQFLIGSILILVIPLAPSGTSLTMYCFIFCSLENSKIPEAAQRNLEKVRLSLDRPSDKELDINYLHHAQVINKRNQSNVI